MMEHEAVYRHAMELAIAEAAQAADEGEVPAGCVILRRPEPGKPVAFPGAVPVLGRGHNQTQALCDATAHAEMIAITQAAAATGDWRLVDTVLVVTKEPCAMCAGAIVLARIPVVVWGVSDPRRGGESVFHILRSEELIHRAEIFPGILEDRCREQLVSFFRERRTEKKDGGIKEP